MTEKMIFPMRINRYLALKNISSRREADTLIKQEKISINGRLAILGDRVNEGDVVEIIKKIDKENIYLAFNKPPGIITHSPQGDEKSIADILSFPTAVFPIGRLDKDSSGLIILTNDGRITGKLLSPEGEREKEYIVKVNKETKDSFIGKMARGVMLDDAYKTKECIVKKLGMYTFKIILTEGKKRQIRRMCTALGFEVLELQRVRIMNIELGKLEPGRYRRLAGEELKNFLDQLGLGSPKEGCTGSVI